MLNCSIRQRSWCKTSENMCHFAILLRSQTLQALNQIRSSRHLPSAAMPRCAFLCLDPLVYVRFTPEADEPTATLLTFGRVITRRRGYGRAATGEVCCKVAVSIIFFRFRSGRQPGSSSGHPDQLSGCAEVAAEPSQAAIAAISGLTPTMFMTRVRL